MLGIDDEDGRTDSLQNAANRIKGKCVRGTYRFMKSETDAQIQF